MGFWQFTTIAELVISFLVALGTIGLALIAFLQILRTRKQLRNRQLDEIIEWANSAEEWKFNAEDNEILESAKQPWMASFSIISGKIEYIDKVGKRAKYMKKTAHDLKQANLEKAIHKLGEYLALLYLQLHKLRSSIDFNASITPKSFIKNLDDLGAIHDDLVNSISKVEDIANNIKLP